MFKYRGISFFMRRMPYLVFLLRINSAIINSTIICSLQL